MSRIDDLLADPKFKQLMAESPDKARAFVQQMKQHDFGIIPKHENFLQNVINGAGSFARGFRDVETMGMHQLGDMAGEAFSDKFIKPNFSPEVNARADKMFNSMNHEDNNPTAYAAGASIPVIHGGIALAKGIGSLFDVAGARRSMSDVIQNSAKRAAGKIEETSHLANKAMGEGLAKLKDTGLTQESVNEALRKTAAVHPNLAEEITPLIKSVSPEVDAASGVVKDIPSLSGQQLQQEIVNTADGIKHPVAKAEFWNQMKELLPDSMKEIKSARAGVYGATEAAKPLTKIGNLNKIAKGTMGPQQLSELQSAEKGIGTNSIQDLIKSGSKVRSTQNAQKVAKVGGRIGTYAGIEELIRHLWNK